MQDLLNPRQMGEELVRDLKDCDPMDRVKLAHGYGAHVEAYANAKVLEHLLTFRQILSKHSLKESKEILDSAIAEIETGESVVGTKEGISGKLEA